MIYFSYLLLFLFILLMTIFLYPISIFFTGTLILIFILIKILNKYIFLKKILFSLFMLVFILFIFSATLYIKTSLYLNNELVRGNNNKQSFKEIFFNDFYKYLGKNNMVLLLNKKYDYAPNTEVQALRKDHDSIIYNVKYTIDKHKNRFCKCNKNAEDTYVFAGCSLIFGVGVEDNETLPYYFSKILNFRSNVINIGFPGGGIHTTLEKIESEDFQNLLKGKKFKYLFYNLTEDHPFRAYIGRFQDNVFRVKKDKLYLKEKNLILKSKFFDTMQFDRNFIILFKNLYKNKFETLTICLLKQLNKDISEKYNSKLIVFSYEDNDIIKKIFKILRQNNIECLQIRFDHSSKEDGYYGIIGDGHPTANANKEIAEILFSYINEK